MLSKTGFWIIHTLTMICKTGLNQFYFVKVTCLKNLFQKILKYFCQEGGKYQWQMSIGKNSFGQWNVTPLISREVFFVIKYKSLKLKTGLELDPSHPYSSNDITTMFYKLICQLRAPTQGVEISWWVNWIHLFFARIRISLFFFFNIQWKQESARTKSQQIKMKGP